MNYQEFLNGDINALKEKKNKEAIINNEDKYNFVYFCQEATTEQIDSLLDKEGINILINSSDLYTKLNGLITCGHDFNCFKNKQLCDSVFKTHNFNYVSGLKENSALDFFNYIKENYPDNFVTLYNLYSEESQMFLLDNVYFSYDEKNELFIYSKKETAKYMLDNYDIFLYDLSYYELSNLADEQIKIPKKCISEKLKNEIVSINDVKTYRLLMDKLSHCFDTSEIEVKRKLYYLKQIAGIDDGLLKKYKGIKEEENYKEYIYSHDLLNKHLGSFVPDYHIMNSLRDKGVDEAIKFESDFNLSNMIIDYVFEDIPTNVLLNINNLLEFQKGEGKTLSDEDIELYTKIASIDKMSLDEKLKLFEKIMDLDLKTKFYHDYSTAKDKMIDSINENILNDKTIKKYKNEELSNKTGVDVYYLDGDDFYVLVKSLKSTKDYLLSSDIYSFKTDGASFSVDSSSKLKTFEDPREYYNLAYIEIPKHQLVHAFPTDSFSLYSRNQKGLPEYKASQRVNYIMPVDDFVSKSNSYNELVISVKNSTTREDNEINNNIKNPIPFALYCYDEITENDIETAKKYNLGIILVNTKKYTINNDGKLDMHDTMSNATGMSSYDYADVNSDERKMRF